MKITVSITTRNRYETTLPLCLLSVINQTLLPFEIILVDDNTDKKFHEIPISKSILKLIKLKNIKFSYYHGESKGQVHAQQIALENSNTDWIYKMDDDNILNPDVLEILSKSIDNKTGAISGLIFGFDQDSERKSIETGPIYNKIEHVFSHFNIQMCGGQDKVIKKCEHLYSNFLFNKTIAKSYALDFSPAGHREDTVFTHQIYRDGFDLLVNPNAIIYHIHGKTGGNKIHGFDDIVKNEEMFISKLIQWEVVPQKLKIIRKNKTIIASIYNKEYLIYSF